ncbi:hypothetical protein EV702DRAFT_1197423 [Suillus placidus]|uniref:Uncharacterized protein n=1 Tax=Suillus placidus TaxID=48579 RepID=A0A9P7D1U0_9AGAM|nr:hypothetical protein EV702DRAFT_1197423 [Suillus placidus]
MSSAGPPVALLDPMEPTHFLVTPADIKDATAKYFIDLFTRQQWPPVSKPWLSTPSVTANSVLSYAREMQDQHQDLTGGRNGKSNTCLIHALHLVNYEILHSHFPSCTKPSTLTTIHKQDSKFMLSNYCGICCSSFLLNTPFAWLNSLLIPYLARLHVIPEGQIATQPGVQAQDLLSFLAQIESAYGWATRWDKSELLVLNVFDPPDFLDMPSIDPSNPSAIAPIEHPVHVMTKHTEFLRVRVNDPEHQYQHLDGIVSSFQLPDLPTWLPLTALR